MPGEPKELYLDLLQRTLSFRQWDEPPIPITTFNFCRSFVMRIVVTLFSSLFGKFGVILSKRYSVSDKERAEGRTWPGYAHTMVGLKRLDNLRYCLETILNDAIEGDIVETGVWRGGACIFARGLLAAYGCKERRVFLADSFAGLPKPDAGNYPSDQEDKHYAINYLAVSEEEVRRNFEKYGLLDEQVVFIKGWFKDTLPNARIEKIAVLRLDGDMESSTWEALSSLYPKLSRGGFCIIDDYALKGCRTAVDRYRAEHAIDDEMYVIDWTGRYWRKGP